MAGLLGQQGQQQQLQIARAEFAPRAETAWAAPMSAGTEALAEVMAEAEEAPVWATVAPGEVSVQVLVEGVVTVGSTMFV